MSSLFDSLPPARKPQEPAQRPASDYAFPHPRPANPRRLTDGEKACACGLAATCSEGAAAWCPWCAPASFWPGRAR